MLIAQVTRNGWDRSRRYIFASEQATLVNGPGTEVRILERDDELAVGYLRHLRGCLRLEPRGLGTLYVNGQLLKDRHMLSPADEVRVGLFRYRFWCGAPPATIARTPYRAIDPTEQQLIDELAHPATRAVYADWLELRGEDARAAFLRTQDALLDAPADGAEALRAQLTALAAEASAGWRAVVANPSIDRCDGRFRFQCPRQWGDLVRTDRDDVRRCLACDREVHYAISVGEARRHAAQDRGVALDITSARWYADLEPPYGDRCTACGADLSPHYPVFGCDHCGFVVQVPGVEID